MKLIITDGATLNPGDQDWSPFNDFGQVDYFDSTTPAEAADRCRDAGIIITNKTIINRETIVSCADLKMIAVTATGYNNIDIKAARERGVVVCNVPEYGTYSVAQHTFALLLELVNHVGNNAAAAANDGWNQSGIWSFTIRPITELKGKTLGIVGLGRIGKQVGIIAAAFGMNIIFHNRSTISYPGATQTTLDRLFAESDVVSLHCPLTPDNQGMVSLPLLSTMKPTALLLNTSRGPLINEQDLATALDKKLIAGAALDVLSQEPPPPGHPLTHHPKCLVTPHNAWISVEARSRLMRETIQNIGYFLKGAPVNVVN